MSRRGPGSRGGRRFLMKRFPRMMRGMEMNAAMRSDQPKDILGFSRSLLIIIGPGG